MITELKRDSESFKNQKQQTQQNTTSYIHIEFPKFVLFGIKHRLHEHLEL